MNFVRQCRPLQKIKDEKEEEEEEEEEKKEKNKCSIQRGNKGSNTD